MAPDIPARYTSIGEEAPFTITNEQGSGPIVLVCDHASNFIPSEYANLGLGVDALEAHIAWDPGALGVSQQLSHLLDAPLIYSNISRLVIDCNRETNAHDLIPAISEKTKIPGNQHISEQERVKRIALSHTPFHTAIEGLIERRIERQMPTCVVSIHSYTPVYKDISRPWEIGLIYRQHNTLTRQTLGALQRSPDLTVGDNEPYSPADGVYYTLQRHGDERGLKSLMIEIRNDEIASSEQEVAWANRLAPLLKKAALETGEAHA